MDNKENIDTKTRQYDNFDKNVWKTDDKVWMKERRAGWSSVRRSLDHMFTHNRHIFRDKKPYKYIKQFYLTGSIDFPEEIGGISYINAILDMNSPLDMWYAGGDIGGLLECWLTPEPSKEKWEQVFERYEQVWIKRKEPENVGRIFEECRICYRNSLVNWYTEPDQVSLFGDIENNLTEFFEPFPYAKNFHDYLLYWEILIPHFCRTCRWESGVPVYNPNHPIYSCSTQIISSLIGYYDSNLKLIEDGRSRELEEFINIYENSPKEFLKHFNYDSEKQTIEEFFDQSKIYVIEKHKKKFLKRIKKCFSFLYFIKNSKNKLHFEQVEFTSNLLKNIQQLDLPDELRKVLMKGRYSSHKKKIKTVT